MKPCCARCRNCCLQDTYASISSEDAYCFNGVIRPITSVRVNNDYICLKYGHIIVKRFRYVCDDFDPIDSISLPDSFREIENA